MSRFFNKIENGTARLFNKIEQPADKIFSRIGSTIRHLPYDNIGKGLTEVGGGISAIGAPEIGLPLIALGQASNNVGKIRNGLEKVIAVPRASNNSHFV